MTGEAFRHCGFFVLRTPLLPLAAFRSWTDAALAACTGSDPEEDLPRRLRAGLRDFAGSTVVREALFLASPDLHDQLDPWLDGADNPRLEETLTRYFARLTARPTPFGLFAGVSVGRCGGVTEISLAAIDAYRRRTRLGMTVVLSLATALARDQRVRPSLRYRVNPGAYRVAGHLRHIERRVAGGKHLHVLSSAALDTYLQAILDAAQRPSSLADIKGALQARFPDLDTGQIDSYLASLVDTQILVSDLDPPATGRDPLAALIDRLAPIAELSPLAGELAAIRRELADLDSHALGGVPAARYRQIDARLSTLPATRIASDLFHVDLLKPAPGATLGDAVVAEIAAAVRILHRLTDPRRQVWSRLRTFADQFRQRFGDRAIPLPLALDEELGVSYAFSAEPNFGVFPLLSDLPFLFHVPAEAASWSHFENRLLPRLTAALTTGSFELELTSRDLDELAEDVARPPLPPAFCVQAAVAAASPAHLARGDFSVLVLGAQGPSGARLMGRFCDLDADLEQAVAGHLLAEERLFPDCILAEVVYLPENLKTCNVVLRPLLRRFEIPHLCRSGALPEDQIQTGDILVSVEEETIRLRWPQHGKEIIPRLSTAHAYGRLGNGLYRFLCDLQEQGFSSVLGWSWRGLAAASFLPRVRYGRVVLARAQWRLSADEVGSLLAARKTSSALRCALDAIRQRRVIPRFVVFDQGHEELPLDLDNLLSVRSFLALIGPLSHVVLTELYPPPDQLVASGPEGAFVHELVLPFVDREPRAAMPLAAVADLPPARRHLALGSEWLYLALFTAPSLVDRLLLDSLRPLVAELSRAGAIDRWFFVRYPEPSWNLRLRLHGSSDRLLREVLPSLSERLAPLLGDGTVRSLQYDTYEREVERYGGEEGIDLAERVFHCDSEAALATLALVRQTRDRHLRWQLTVLGIDFLLSFLGFDAPSKRFIVGTMRDAVAQRFRLDLHRQKRVNQLSRRFRADLARLLDETSTAALDPAIAAGDATLLSHAQGLMAPGQGLHQLWERRRLLRPPAQLAASFVHMAVNRLTPSAHLQHELAIYEVLSRVYERHAHGQQTRTRAEAYYRARSPRPAGQDAPGIQP